jgi:hypothetical protein
MCTSAVFLVHDVGHVSFAVVADTDDDGPFMHNHQKQASKTKTKQTIRSYHQTHPRFFFTSLTLKMVSF